MISALHLIFLFVNLFPEMDKAVNFLLEIADAILLDEDFQISDAFCPLLELLYKEMRNSPSLSNSRNAAYCTVIELFTRRPCLAQILMKHLMPKDPKKAKSYEESVIGILLSLSCVPKHQQPSEFFINPSRSSQRDHTATQQFLWQPIAILNESVYNIFKGIFKSSMENKNKLLAWLGNCLHCNAGMIDLLSTTICVMFLVTDVSQHSSLEYRNQTVNLSCLIFGFS